MSFKPRILFLGTPEFAVPSLRRIVEDEFPVVGVVTTPDRPADRGLRLKSSPVKVFAKQAGLTILQPENLKDPSFLESLKMLKPDIGVVVAFRMLPQQVWTLPHLGMFNLHASYLPQYRGAAPMNWAIINGEQQTGLTTFLLNEAIDTGRILFRERISIGSDETVGELHDRLMIAGAALVVRSIIYLASGDIKPIDQAVLIADGEKLKAAPKIFRHDCRIGWDQNVHSIYNRIRGLSPYPGAYTDLIFPDGSSHELKIYLAQAEVSPVHLSPGTFLYDGKRTLKVAAKNGYIHLKYIHLAGRKPMETSEFLKGYAFCFV